MHRQPRQLERLDAVIFLHSVNSAVPVILIRRTKVVNGDDLKVDIELLQVNKGQTLSTGK